MKKIKEFIRSHKVMQKLWALGRQLFMLGISYVVLYPLLYMVSNAFKPVEQYYDPSVVWIPKSLTMENFKIVALVMDIGNVMKNTVIIELLPAIISAMVCMMIGYGLARFNFRGKRFVVACVILTIIVPQQTIASSLYSSFRYFDFLGILKFLHRFIPAVDTINLIGTPWVTILPSLLGVGLKSGIFIFIYMQFFTGLPKELQEAAAIDGASHFQYFFKVVLPLSATIVAVLSVYYGVGKWNDYYTGLVYMKDKSILPLQTVLRQILATLNYNASDFAEMFDDMAKQQEAVRIANVVKYCAIIVSTVPAVILYLFMQKYFVKGVMIGSIKG